jgi:fibronectin type 3 domain-containing protein
VATAGNGQVGLDWDDNSEPDLIGYNIYRSQAQGGPYAKLNAYLVRDSTYTDTGVANGTTYYYVATAVDKCANESGYSSEHSATPAAVPPTAPTGLAGTPGFEQIALDWANNTEPDLAGYNVYRSQTQGGPYTKVNVSLVSASDYTDSGLTNGTTYYYVVTAENTGAMESSYSNEASATPEDEPPLAPTGLIATPGNTQVGLDWNDNSEPDLAGYNVYRSQTQGGPYTQVNVSLVSASDYIDPGLTNGTTYYYVVTAVDTASNESGGSAEASATPDALPPGAPTGLLATSGDKEAILDWDDNSEPDLAGYNVYRSQTQGGPYTKVNVSLVSTSAYTDAGLDGGVTYYYVVTAENTSAMESGYSAEASATPYSMLIATGDSYVRQSRANANYGTDTEILIMSRSGRASRGLVVFDVSSIPAGSTINSAVLTLCATSFPSQTRTYEVRRVTGSWVEGTVTWNNQPTVSSSVTDSAATPGAPGCVSWTITADVQAFIDGTSNYGWRVGDVAEDSSTTLDTDFRSREDSSVPEERPNLKVYFTAP